MCQLRQPRSLGLAPWPAAMGLLGMHHACFTMQASPCMLHHACCITAADPLCKQLACCTMHVVRQQMLPVRSCHCRKQPRMRFRETVPTRAGMELAHLQQSKEAIVTDLPVLFVIGSAYQLCSSRAILEYSRLHTANNASKALQECQGSGHCSAFLTARGWHPYDWWPSPKHSSCTQHQAL